MNKDSLIQLTNKLYQVTLLFPKKEPLRYKMREVADEILAENCSLPKLEVLDNFFEVAKAQNWVKQENILNLQEEYSKLREEAETQEQAERQQKAETQEQDQVIELPQAPQQAPSSGLVEGEPSNISPDNNGRQKIILDFLKENGRAQVGDLVQILPDVTKRTLRRDFRALLNQGLIERIGQRNETFYRLR